MYNWLNRKYRNWGFIVVDKTPYGAHGRRVHSWHKTREGAARELRRLVRSGDSTQCIEHVRA